jgi:hypothetical protein
MNLKTGTLALALVACVRIAPCRAAEPDIAKIPILYSTDLFHPHVDPDDHYDLATLFAIEEFDIRGVILDNAVGDRWMKRYGHRDQKTTCGRPAVDQMMHITRRKVPCVIGLHRPLGSRTDKAAEDPVDLQGGVELILKTLRESKEPVVLFSVGSCRDVAVACNREPELMKAKVKAYYPNVGTGPSGPQSDYNVTIDPEAYARVFDAGLPMCWSPCVGKEGYLTQYVLKSQSAVIGGCIPAVQNYFVYALTRSKEEPIAFLAGEPRPPQFGSRKMWCTAPFIHAAGRKIYQRGPDDYVALQPTAAAKAGLAAKEVKVFEFVPIQASIGADKKDDKGNPVMDGALNPAQPNGNVFHISDDRYGAALDSCLKNLLAGLGRPAVGSGQ